MYKVFNRPLSRSNKKDLTFKLYIEQAIKYILDNNESFQDWLNSSFPFWPGNDEMRHINQLVHYRIEVKNQLEFLEEKKVEYEDECYKEEIQDYVNETTSSNGEEGKELRQEDAEELHSCRHCINDRYMDAEQNSSE